MAEAAGVRAAQAEVAAMAQQIAAAPVAKIDGRAAALGRLLLNGKCGHGGGDDGGGRSGGRWTGSSGGDRDRDI